MPDKVPSATTVAEDIWFLLYVSGSSEDSRYTRLIAIIEADRERVRAEERERWMDNPEFVRHVVVKLWEKRAEFIDGPYIDQAPDQLNRGGREPSPQEGGMRKALFRVTGTDLRNDVRCRMLNNYEVIVCDPAVNPAEVRLKLEEPGAHDIIGYLDVAKYPWQGPNNPNWNKIRDALGEMEDVTADGVKDPDDGRTLILPTFDLAEATAELLGDTYVRRWGFDGVYLDDCWGEVPERITDQTFRDRWPYYRDYLLDLLTSDVKAWANVGTPFVTECGLHGLCLERPDAMGYAWLLNSGAPKCIAWYSNGVPGTNVLGGDNWT